MDKYKKQFGKISLVRFTSILTSMPRGCCLYTVAFQFANTLFFNLHQYILYEKTKTGTIILSTTFLIEDHSAYLL